MGIKQKLWSEFKTFWFNAFYITLFFSVFTDYKRLVLAHYQISYTNYGVSIINGLVLAKVILIADHLHIGRRFEDKPLIIPTLYKSFLFTLCVAVLSMIESVIRGLFKTGSLSNMFGAFRNNFSYEWFAAMLVVFAVFIPFFVIRELNRVLGEGKIMELFFLRRDTSNPR